MYLITQWKPKYQREFRVSEIRKISSWAEQPRAYQAGRKIRINKNRIIIH